MFQGRVLTHEIQNTSLYLFFKTPTPITADYQQLSEEQALRLDNDSTAQWSCFDPAPAPLTIPHDFKQLLHIDLSDAHAVFLFG